MWEKSEMIPIKYQFWSPEYIDKKRQKVNHDLWLLVKQQVWFEWKLCTVKNVKQQWFEVIDQDCCYADSIKSLSNKSRKQEENSVDD